MQLLTHILILNTSVFAATAIGIQIIPIKWKLNLPAKEFSFLTATHIDNLIPYNVKFGYENIIAEAKRRNADIVLFGHTHNQYTEYLDGLYIMNPGSVGMNGDYGVIDITPKGDIMLIKEHI